MALLKCIECKHDVSEYAQHCMYCGCPVSITLEKIEEEKERLRREREAERKVNLILSSSMIWEIMILLFVLNAKHQERKRMS